VRLAVWRARLIEEKVLAIYSELTPSESTLSVSISHCARRVKPRESLPFKYFSSK
jgi:hypothetical protein